MVGRALGFGLGNLLSSGAQPEDSGGNMETPVDVFSSLVRCGFRPWQPSRSGASREDRKSAVAKLGLVTVYGNACTRSAMSS